MLLFKNSFRNQVYNLGEGKSIAQRRDVNVQKVESKLDVYITCMVIIRCNYNEGGSAFIQLYCIFKPTTKEMKDWKLIENNETRVKQIFKK